MQMNLRLLYHEQSSVLAPNQIEYQGKNLTDAVAPIDDLRGRSLSLHVKLKRGFFFFSKSFHENAVKHPRRSCELKKRVSDGSPLVVPINLGHDHWDMTAMRLWLVT